MKQQSAQKNKTKVRPVISAFLFYFFMLATINGQAQYFNFGQSPSGIKWKKISTIHFEVIFPENFEKEGQRVANMMEQAYYSASKTLNHQPKRVSVILHTQTVKSNAFLGWSPSRIEMFTTPHQGIYAQDWLEQLAIHEFRHMVQMSKIESEMPQLLRYLLGEQAAAAITAAHIPFWLIEGDAVSTETALSHSGRGRQPDFHIETKAHLAYKKPYSYSKAYLGSYKNHVPNHYQMGYLVTAGARYLYNKPVWDEVWHHIARKPLSFNAFDVGLKKSIGLKKTELYDTVYQHLQEKWRNDLALIIPNTFQVVSPKKNVYTNYLHGTKINEYQYFAKRSSLNDIDRFILIDSSGKEKIITTPGSIFSESVSSTAPYLAWSERVPHARWEHADKSMLTILNIESGKKNRKVFNSKIFAPSLSPDHQKIAYVEADNQYRSFIIIADANTFKEIGRIDDPGIGYFISPCWSDNSESIYAVALKNNQKGIIEYMFSNGQISTLLPYSNYEISHLSKSPKGVVYRASYTGTNELYELNLQTNKITQLTSSHFGVSHPSMVGNTLVYSHYTGDGYQLVSSQYDSLLHQPFEISGQQASYPLAEAVAAQDAGVEEFNKDEWLTYGITNYKRFANVINFHSWAPVFIDPYQQNASPGISMVSQNNLSTAEALLGYKYDIDNKEGTYLAKFKYMGLFPVFEAETNFGKKNSSYKQLNTYTDHLGEIVRIDTITNDFSWNQTMINLTSYLPLDFSKGKYYKHLRPRIDFQRTNIDLRNKVPKEIMPSGAYHILGAGLFMYIIQRSSQQDLLSNFGFIADIHYATSLKGSANFGQRLAVATQLYLPGIRPNHGIKMHGNFQKKISGDYRLTDRVRMARGHQRVLNDQLVSAGIDYHLPLFSPDWELGRVLYLKRVKAALFYDQSWVQGIQLVNNVNTPYNFSLQSAGIELNNDIHLFRFIAPIEAGIRYAYLFNNKSSIDFLFNIRFSF
jgi:hypothetical protein